MDTTSNDNLCTFGFMVRIVSTGGVGPATADHCAGATTRHMRNPNENVSTATNVTLQWRTRNNRDLAFYSRGTYSLSKQFYANYEVIRTVADEWYPQQGEYTAGFGRTTGYKGSQIISESTSAHRVIAE